MNNIVVSVHLCHSSSALMTKLIIKSTFMVFSINFFYPARRMVAHVTDIFHRFVLCFCFLKFA